MAVDLDRRERQELCDRFLALGPDAPTLSGSWTTADLAAHLVVRERDPRAMPGIIVRGRFEPITERLMAKELARGYEAVVERVRTGPPPGPMRIPGVSSLVNLFEYFVHHEDVRRANGLTRRTDRPDLDDGLWRLLRRSGRFLTLRARLRGIRLELARPDGERTAAGRGPATVSLTGEPTELVLFLYGRHDVAEIELAGPTEAVARVRDADFAV